MLELVSVSTPMFHVGAKFFHPQYLARSNLMAIALLGVRALNAPRKTNPFSSLVDPVTFTET